MSGASFRKRIKICNCCESKCEDLCSFCNVIYYCNEECQKKDWDLHKDLCSVLPRLLQFQYISLFQERKPILLAIDISKQDMLMHSLLFKTRNRIQQLGKSITISPLLTSELVIYLFYDYHEEYMYNILLMIRIYLNRRDSGNAKEGIKFLYSEWRTFCNKAIYDKYFLERPTIFMKNNINYRATKFRTKRYLQLYKGISLSVFELNNIFLFQKTIHSQIEFTEKLLNQTLLYDFYFGYIALLIGELFVKRGMLMNAIEFYTAAINYFPKGYEADLLAHENINFFFALNYNQAILNYATGHCDKAEETLKNIIKLFNDNSSTPLSEKILNQYVTIYLFKVELEIASKHYIIASRNVGEIMTILKNDKDMKKIYDIEYFKIFLNELLSQIEQGLEANNAETSNIVVEKIQIPKQKEQEIEHKDLEKFFLFLIQLSMYQLRIFNKTQPDLKRHNCQSLSLPIYYSSEFKLCLTNNQRLSLKDITIMNLIRNKILTDPSQPISISNLNFIHYFPERVAEFIIAKDTKEQLPILITLLKNFLSKNSLDSDSHHKIKPQYDQRQSFSVHLDANELLLFKIRFFQEGCKDNKLFGNCYQDENFFLKFLSELTIEEKNELIRNLLCNKSKS